MRRRVSHFGPLPSTAPTPAARRLQEVQPLPQTRSPGRLLRWALYGFAFSLAFDAPDRLPIEVTTFTGALFLLATLWQPRLCYGRRPAPLWWFGAFLCAYWLAYVFGYPTSGVQAAKSFVFYLQGVLIFWACFNLMRYDGITKRILITLVIASATLAIMTILGIGKLYATDSGRAVVFGQDPNLAARTLGVGLLTVVGLAYGRANRVLRPFLMAWPLAALIGLAMILGGSRGQLVALAVGLWAFSLTGNTFGARVKHSIVAILAIGLVTWGALQSPVMQRRIEKARLGNLAQREDIFPAAWQMFKDRPLTGWGPASQTVLATRLRLPPAQHQTRGTHNLFLAVLTSTGLLGAIPFMIGLWLCTWAAWKARRGTEGSLPVVQMAALWVANLTINFIVLKMQWVLLAYALTSASFLTPRSLQQPAVLAHASRNRRR